MEVHQQLLERTAAAAKWRMLQLTEEAFQCHDEMQKLQRLRQRQRTDQQEVTQLRQKMSDLIDEINQEGLIVGMCVHSDGICKWRRLPAEKKWSVQTLGPLFFPYVLNNNKIRYEYLEHDWNAEAPEQIQNDRHWVSVRMMLTELPSPTFPFYSSNGGFPIRFPAHLWEDKLIVCRAVHYFPEALLLQNLVPERFLSDEDVFRAFIDVEPRGDCLQEKETFWKNEEFLALVSRFPAETIRSNATLMLKLVKKCGLCLQYVDESLKGNVDIVQAACEQTEAALNYCEPALRANAEFMHRACTKHAAAWTYCTPQLKESMEFLRSVCEQSPQVLKYCGPEAVCARNAAALKLCSLVLEATTTMPHAGNYEGEAECLRALKEKMEPVSAAYQAALTNGEQGPAKQFLSSDLSICRNVLESVNHFPLRRQLFVSLPEVLQCDRGILDLLLPLCLPADHNFMPDEFPLTLLENRGFWLDVCGHLDFPRWERLPAQFKTDPEFVAAFRFQSRDVVDQVLRYFPYLHLDENRSFWVSVLESEGRHIAFSTVDLGALILRAPLEIRHDRELMLLACKKNPSVYTILDEHLEEDKEILSEALSASINQDEDDFFFGIKKRVQSLYPELTVKSLEVDLFSRVVVFDDIAEDLRENLEVMKAFIHRADASRDFPPLPENFSNALKDNEDFGVFVAEYLYTGSELRTVTSEALHSRKSFIKKAIEQQFRLFFNGDREFYRDFDIGVIALSQLDFRFQEPIGSRDRRPSEADRAFLRSVAIEARERVVTFKGFTQGFLYGLNDKAGPECHLPALILDEATTLETKKMIAQFAGVPAKDVDIPTKVELRRIRLAALHLLSTFMPDNHTRLSPFSLNFLHILYDGV